MEIAMASWRSEAAVILSLCCIQLFFVSRSEHDSVITELLKSPPFGNVDVNYDYFYDGDGQVDDLSVHVQYRDGFQEDGLKSHHDYFYEKGVRPADDFSSYPTYKVASEYSTQKADLKDDQKYLVFCSEDSMKIVLPLGLLSEVKIFGIWGMDSVLEAPKSCGYSLTQEQDHNVFTVSYSGCRVTVEGGSYTLRILYRDDAGRVEIATASCDTSSGNAASLKPRFLQSDQPPKPRPPMPLLEMSSHSGCLIPNSQRVECTASGADQCLSKGCCMDVENDACYYPMNECTADGEFVFAVSTNVMNVTVNPLSLVVAERSDCKPVVATKDFVIFKFGVTECGTHCYSIGETTVYLAELQSSVRKLNLKYGVITRDQPIRLMVECRYTKGAVARASAGYMVVSASRPASVTSEGLFGVQLRIAEDKTFSRFYAYHHQPLRVLLGKSVYLEVRLNSPNPKATLLVHYCVAYPRSAKNALVLLYEGCPNPLDSETTSILHMADLQQNRHRRRFEIKAFQFMDQSTDKLLNEEIYFMCSTEVCLPSKTPCRETCFDEVCNCFTH